MQVMHLKAERDVLQVLNHPFIVRMVGSFQDNASVYFVMEFVCGGEFFRHLKARGR
jgi:protein kinase A